MKLGCLLHKTGFVKTEVAGTVTQIRKTVKLAGVQKVSKITTLNHEKLETTQIKQCGQEWATIDFNKVTSITMRKQANAFTYFPENSLYDSINIDRKICSDNYKKYIESKVKNNKTIKGSRVSFYDFVKDALNININDKSEEVQSLKQVLNLQWKDNKKQLSKELL